MQGKLFIWTCSRCGSLNMTADNTEIKRFECESCRSMFDEIERI